MKNIIKKSILITALVICLAGLIFAVFKIIDEFPKKNTNNMGGYRDGIEAQAKPDAPELPDNPVDFVALKARNTDICGWIYMPGLEKVYGIPIDYPILQSGNDKPEDFYLNHDVDGNELFDGSIYIQKYNSNDFTDTNTVIYGHDLADKSMFSALRRYRKKEFFDQNEWIYIYSPGHVYKYRIYSAFMFTDQHILYAYDFKNDYQYQQFLDEAANPRSGIGFVREGMDVTTNDRIITLSTCADRKMDRFLVVGVLVEDQLTK